MNKQETVEINIFWWNANDFFHYDANIKKERWPSSVGEYIEKCNRVDAALNALFKEKSPPDILALCEITSKAAHDLKNRILKDYKVFSLDLVPSSPSLQISVFYKNIKSISLIEAAPIVVDDVPRGTRPMAVLDIMQNNKIIRIIFCHWQARLEPANEKYKTRVIEYLTKYIYDFMKNKPSKEDREVMIVGDLNEEPFDNIIVEYLNTHRYRDRALKKGHWADDDVKRIHLYNCTWRLLGEKLNGKKILAPHIAGTYFWADKQSWHTFDQIIVSGGLLDSIPPHIDEGNTEIVNLQEFMPENTPRKFSFSEKGYSGLSDHLPLHTKLII